MSSVWDGKRVTVTGGAGFIGSNLAIRLCGEGAEVTIVDNLSPQAGGNPANLEGFQSRLTFLEGNIQNPDVATRAVENSNVVFHCAALSSHSGSLSDPIGNINTNCVGAIQLLEAAKECNQSCKFVFVGTTTQLGKLVYQPADEDHPEFPLDIYSANKCASEKYALIYSRKFNLQTTVVRLPNVYGERAAIHSPEYTSNNYFLGLALTDQKITLFGGGGQRRNFLYVGDAVEALMCAAIQKESLGKVYLAVSDDHISVKEMAEAIVAECGSGNVEEIPYPEESQPLEVGDAIFTNKKIKAELGWSPATPLSRGLERTCEFYRPRLSDYIKSE